MTVHALPPVQSTLADHPGDAQRQRNGRMKVLLVLLACAAPVVASYITYYVVRPEGRNNYASLIAPSRAWPLSLPLRDDAGRPFDAATLKHQWLLVSMGSGTCDTPCESRLFAQRQLREMLGRERDRIDKVFIAVDDAPLGASLRQALETPPAARILHAPRAAVAAWLGVDAAQLDQHLYVVDPMGQWMMKTPVDLEPAKFKRDLDRVLRASASWDRAGR